VIAGRGYNLGNSYGRFRTVSLRAGVTRLCAFVNSGAEAIWLRSYGPERKAATAPLVGLFGTTGILDSFRGVGMAHSTDMAMGASNPAEHLLRLRAALRDDDHARLLLYGFYDFQLADPVAVTFSDLIGNHDLLYYDEPEFARRYYSMSRYDATGFEIARRFPLLAERGAIWAKVEQVRRAISQQGMPTQATNPFGRVADFTLLEAKSQDEFVNIASAHLRSR
jgi:hypothetical protein